MPCHAIHVKQHRILAAASHAGGIPFAQFWRTAAMCCASVGAIWLSAGGPLERIGRPKWWPKPNAAAPAGDVGLASDGGMVLEGSARELLTGRLADAVSLGASLAARPRRNLLVVHASYLS